MAILMNAATGGEGAGAGGAAVGAAGAGAAGAGAAAQQTPAPPAFDAQKAKAEARAETLREMGFTSEEAYKAHLEEKKAADEEKRKAEDAKLSDGERHKKLYNEAQEARAKTESKYEAEKAARKAAEDALALRDRLDTHGVAAGERKFVEVELHEAEGLAKKAGQAFDEAKFFADLRAKRPYFFGSAAQAQAATTGTRQVAAATTKATTQSGYVNAAEMTDEQWRAWNQHN
jgi:membrane protein involved in colicin uptake